MLRTLIHLWRLFGIVRTLARHDALFPFEDYGIAPGVVRIAKLTAFHPFHRSRRTGRPGQRLAAALQELGPSFIKLGQSLAVRSDLMGEDIARDLSELQDRLPPFSSAEAKRTIEEELDRSIAELYASFEDVPVAAASIAQVHLAVTPAGDEVAVKVLRPGIEARFDRDLELFYWLAHLVERRPALRRLRPVAVVRTFEETVRVEMDLRLEASAASELAGNFADDPDFRVPAIDWQRTARRVLTLERIDGIRIDDVLALKAEGFDPGILLERCARVFFNQAFRDGFFHADLHPGNMFVARSGPWRGALMPVDFGIMGRLDKATRNFLADMLLGFLERDYQRVTDVHFAAGYVPPDKSPAAFMQAVRAIGEPIFGRPMHEISIARLLAQLFQVTETFEMETQPQLLLLQKTMLVAEGVGRRLDPTTNMWLLAQPLMEEWMRENRGPEARLRELVTELAPRLERLPALLAHVDRIVETIDAEGLKLHPDTVRALREDQSAAVFGLRPGNLRPVDYTARVWLVFWLVALSGFLMGLLF